jgi:hypothetical protein
MVLGSACYTSPNMEGIFVRSVTWKPQATHKTPGFRGHIVTPHEDRQDMENVTGSRCRTTSLRARLLCSVMTCWLLGWSSLTRLETCGGYMRYVDSRSGVWDYLHL